MFVCDLPFSQKSVVSFSCSSSAVFIGFIWDGYRHTMQSLGDFFGIMLKNIQYDTEGNFQSIVSEKTPVCFVYGM